MFTIFVVSFLAIVASFVAGAIYGRKAEAAAIAESKKVAEEVKAELKSLL